MATLDSQLIAPIAPTLKQRNAFFDALFYDVGKLTSEEKDGLSPLVDREGSIINVPPGGTARKIEHYSSATAFLHEQKQNVRAVVIAGVGSSVLGTAALARNVANAYQIDVAGIVSGYGASDLVAEAMGGWFFYGVTDAIQHEIKEAMKRLSKASPAHTASTKEALAIGADISALDEILDASPPKLSLLAGQQRQPASGLCLGAFCEETYSKPCLFRRITNRYLWCCCRPSIKI